MKNKNKLFRLCFLLVLGLLFVSTAARADTVEISTAQTSMQDLETISGGAATKTALVTSTGSVDLSSTTDPAIWASAAGWTVTVSSGRTVAGGNYGILFNTASDATGTGIAGTLINAGAISASGSTGPVYGVRAGDGSSITNQSGATISGANEGTDRLISNYAYGIYTGQYSTVINSGVVSASTVFNYSYGIYAGDASTITNNAGATLSASSTGCYVGTTAYGGFNSYGIKTGANSTVSNAGEITATSLRYQAYGIDAGANSTVINSGSITATATDDGSGYYGGFTYGINAGAGSAITNTSSGSITSTGKKSQYGIYVLNGSTVQNAGTVTSTTSGNNAWGVYALSSTAASSVVNTGTITVSAGDYNAYGVQIYGGTAGSVTNSGAISASVAGSNGRAYGVYLSNGTVTNASGGTISASGVSIAYGVYMGTGTVTNEAGATITSNGTGVKMTGTSTLNNYGTISGVIGIEAAGDDTVIRNYAGGVITGTGGVAISLTGDNNTLLIQDGSTINGSIEASGSGNTLEFNGSGTYVSVISGAWSLLKSGSGILTLTGDSTYTGATTIDAGALAVNGSIASSVTVNTDGTLAGTGTITGDVSSAGTIAPGNSIGTLTVAGDLTFAAGSTYQVEVNAAGESDQTVVSGATTISSDGTTVSVLAESGLYAASTQYTILTSAGGVTGTFADVTSNLAFLTPSLSYDTNNVYLTLTRNSVDFVDVALTRNQRAVAASFDGISTSASGDMATVMTDLTGLSAEGARSAFNATGGLAHLAAAETSQVAFQRYLDMVSGRLRGWGSTAPSFASGILLASLDNTGIAPPAPAGVFWMKGYQTTGSRNGDDISSRYDYLNGGAAVGYDRKIGGRFLIGASAGFGASRYEMNELNDRGNITSCQMALYGSYQAAPWYAGGLIAYGYNRYNTTRNILFGGINRTAEAAYSGSGLSAYAETGYRFNVRSFAVTPLMSLQAGYLQRDGFTETGAGSLNLISGSASTTSLSAALGVRADRAFQTSLGVLTPEVSIRWLHEFLDNDYQLNTFFSGYPEAGFTVESSDVARDSAALGLGAAWGIGENLDLAAGYEAKFANDRSQHGGSLVLKYKW